MTSERKLGETFTRDELQWRVVRITKQVSLFEDKEGVQEVVEEHLLELKSEKGHIDFEVLASERKAYEGPTSPVKAPETIRWQFAEG